MCYIISSGRWYRDIGNCIKRQKSWWRHQIKPFPRYWSFVRGIRRSTVNSPHKGQWRGALMFLWSALWINNWVNNREAGDLRRHRTHYYVIVMIHHRDDKNHIQKSYPKISTFIITQTDIYHKIHCWNWLWGPKTVLICIGASRSEVMSGNLFDTSVPLQQILENIMFIMHNV